MNNLDAILLSISILIIISILIAKGFKNIGVPVMLLFIGVGMLAGSEGPGKIFFNDAQIAQSVGIVSLVLILFSGGLDTKWNKVKPVLWSSLSLATVGVLVTTISIGLFVYYVFNMPFLASLLLGAVISSTDAAAVFSILSFGKVNLKGNVKPLLELESGTNDPMAVFLTISFIELITIKETSVISLVGMFVLEMGLGSIFGIVIGRLMVYLINRLRFPIEGFYPVFTLAFAVLTYALAANLHGSGFLAVYVAGLIVGNNEIVYKRTLFRFFDGLAWLAQIGMFITLGLLVYPSSLLSVTSMGLMVSAFLIFVARPAGVFLSLYKTAFSFKEKLLVSWVGLRGAVPIILATFPLIAGVKQANLIFYVVFFIVLTSALIQGWSTPLVAKILNLNAAPEEKNQSPIEFSYPQNSDMKLINLKIPNRNSIVNKSLVQIPELKGILIVTIFRNGKYFVPSGGTVMEKGDVIQVLTEKEKADGLKKYFSSGSSGES